MKQPHTTETESPVVRSIRRLIDLIYVFTFVWGVGQVVTWILAYGS